MKILLNVLLLYMFLPPKMIFLKNWSFRKINIAKYGQNQASKLVSWGKKIPQSPNELNLFVKQRTKSS